MEPPVPLSQEEKGAILLEMIPKWKNFSSDSSQSNSTESKHDAEIINETDQSTNSSIDKKIEKSVSPSKDSEFMTHTNTNSTNSIEKENIAELQEKEVPKENLLVIPRLQSKFFLSSLFFSNLNDSLHSYTCCYWKK